MIRTVTLLVVLASPVWADTDRKGPPNGFFTGTYEIVGRESGGDTYSGRATITDGGERMIVKRCIAGRVTTGHLNYDEFGVDHLVYLSGQLDDGLPATCDYAIDNDNYARVTCFTGSRDVPPGLEFYVIASDPAPDGEQACTE